MIYQIPSLSPEDDEVLNLIQEQRARFRHQVNQSPTRWHGFLRRNTFARAVRGSNSIEGYNASVDETAAIIDDERPESVAEETFRALSGYRNAMTYILQIHQDPTFELNAQFIKGLHFMMMGHDLANLPGQWRQGAVHVVSEPSGETVHTSPDAELIAGLMNELIAEIYARDGAADIIRAAFIHLNLSMIHPFKDGNGRMARALQTLILAREGILSPAFCSIEEWLGRNISEYYKVLAEVGQGSWNPTNDSAPWVRFCLRAHYQQAATLIKRNQEIGRLWGEVEKIITAYALHDRMEIALMDAAFGLQVRNQRYRQENDISDVMASRDLRKLCELNLLVPVGEKRGRYYTAAAPLKKLREETRDTRRAGDPYELIGQESAPEIPGLQ